jgi:rhodanese-related sulfurtransferase
MYVDVREADELEEGMIEGAVNIPLGQLIRIVRHADINDLKRRKIVTYCNSGYRGNIAADELNKQGFDAVTIEGGCSAWKDHEDKKEWVRFGIRHTNQTAVFWRGTKQVWLALF